MSTAEDDSEGQTFVFSADLATAGFDAAGRLRLTFTVDPGDKYAAFPVTDLGAKKFHITATVKGRVVGGPEGLEEAKRKVRRRRAEREMAARAPGVFENVETEDG